MSTRIGTLEQKKRFKMWPIVAALLAVTALALYLTTADRGTDRKASTVDTTAIVSGTAANTPSELSGGVIGGVSQPNGQIGRRGVTPRVGASAATATAPGIVETVHAQLNAATGDDPNGSPKRPVGPIGFHPLP